MPIPQPIFTERHRSVEIRPDPGCKIAIVPACSDPFCARRYLAFMLNLEEEGLIPLMGPGAIALYLYEKLGASTRQNDLVLHSSHQPTTAYIIQQDGCLAYKALFSDLSPEERRQKQLEDMLKFAAMLRQLMPSIEKIEFIFSRENLDGTMLFQDVTWPHKALEEVLAAAAD